MSSALVIGGTSGIGLAVAEQLARRGGVVHIAGRNPERLEKAMTAIDAAVPGEVQGHVLDAADAEAVAALAASIGPIRHLVITLAGSGGAGPLSDLPLDGLRQAFDEKYWPTLIALQATLAHLTADASITLVGAVTARAAMPGTAGIGSLNAAIEGLIQPLAAELAPVRVNAVSPGYVDTPWWDGLAPEARTAFFKQAAESLPVKQIATASDIAEAIVLLATNPNITGTVIETDGGARLTA
ncbi:SDR family oxidoreductase [Kribbella sindirgiensis]|uniref:SDR family oxidoreductase n=1 Tax=Kribbella sindirgiensis TaxID=1124744 RepID=A0A4R0IA13_9ACTN|nr:SDR family oxidoreductase [Kribbella sindirgiensis]TCC29863.1 SDR family oxidoreductase [Kribbella sindirgiensis]